MIIGRMRVEAGSTPVWEGGDKNPYRRNMLSRLLNQGLGRNYIGNRPVNVSEMVEEEVRDDIKKQIESKIILKFQNDTRYSEKAKQGIQMTITAQAGIQSGVIYKEACYRVGKNSRLQQEIEQLNDSQIVDIYFDEVLNEAMNIVEWEFEFQPNLDIEALTKRETKIKQQLENGEITQEEAKKILEKPISTREEETEKEQNYEEKAYEKERKEQRRRTQRKRTQRSRTPKDQETAKQDVSQEQDDHKKQTNRAKQFRKKQADFEKVEQPTMKKSKTTPTKQKQHQQNQGTDISL